MYEGYPPGSEKWNWEEKAVNASSWAPRIVYDVVTPAIQVFRPACANGTAVLIIPGGGYHWLSVDQEGSTVAQWLNEQGITAFVLKYRTVHSNSGHPLRDMLESWHCINQADREKLAAVQQMAVKDALLALAHIRDQAAAYRIDETKLGILGFSAGGAITLSAACCPLSVEKPAFLALVYPGVVDTATLSIPAGRMPMFLTVSADDWLGLAPATLRIAEKWMAAKQPCELHLYQNGIHGCGVTPKDVPMDGWKDRFTAWLRWNELLPA
nr:alpha/beta hydrolase [Chitinophaga rhizophila]